MPAQREVYPHAPLAMVAAEVRYSYSSTFQEVANMAHFLDELRDRVPVVVRQQRTTINIPLGTEPPSDFPRQVLDVMEARSLDSQVTASISAEAMTVAMSGTAYTQFEDSLRPFLEQAVQALIAAAPGTLVLRAGLRYLDELRVPEPPDEIRGWGVWVEPSLLGGAALLDGVGGRSTEMRCIWQYALPEDRQVVVNLGPFFGTGVVGPDHPFHRVSDPTQMFVLDIDSSWTPPSGTESLQAESLLSVYDGLHEPTQTIFQSALTDEARQLFRGQL